MPLAADRGSGPATDRGVSTVIDVVVALSLVSAAAVVLVTADSSSDQSADPVLRDQATTDIAGSLLSTTIVVSSDSPDGRRTVRGPAGVLLADAALATVPPVTPTEAAFTEATRAEVRAVLGLFGPGIEVVATVPASSAQRPRARIRIGSAPPPGTDVDVVVIQVPSGEHAPTPESVTLVVRTWSA